MIAAAIAVWLTALASRRAQPPAQGEIAPGPRAYEQRVWLPPRCRSSWSKASTPADLHRHPGAAAFPPARRGRGLLRRGQDARAGRLRLFRGLGRDRAPLHRVSRRRRPREARRPSSPIDPVDVLAFARRDARCSWRSAGRCWRCSAGFAQGYSLMFMLAVGLLARAAVGPVERLLNMVGEQRICAWSMPSLSSSISCSAASC